MSEFSITEYSAVISALAYAAFDSINSSTGGTSGDLRPWLEEQCSRILGLPAYSRDVCRQIDSFEVVDFKSLQGKEGVISADEFVTSDLLMLLATFKVEPEKKVTIVGFRGTRPEYFNDWLHSAKLYADFGSMGIVGGRHSGYAALADKVNAYYLSKTYDKDDQRIVFCGHSLGGAVAKLVTINYLLQLSPERRTPDRVSCATFCDPMCCDETFANNLRKLVPEVNYIFKSFLVKGDVVPIIMGISNSSRNASFTSSLAVKVLQGLIGESNVEGAEASVNDMFFPKYSHIGTLTVISDREEKEFPSEVIADIQKVLMPEAPGGQLSVQNMIQLHSLKNVAHRLTAAWRRPTTVFTLPFAASTPKLLFSQTYAASCLPIYSTHATQIIIYKDENQKEVERISIFVYGQNLLSEQKTVIFWVPGEDVKLNLDYRLTPLSEDGTLIKVEIVRRSRQDLYLGKIICILSPYFQPIPLKQNMKVLKGANHWNNADPADILQTSFAYAAFKQCISVSNGAGAEKFADKMNLIRALLEKLDKIDWGSDKTVEVNKRIALILGMDDKIGDMPLRQVDLDYLAEQKLKYLSGKPEASVLPSKETATSVGADAVGLAKELQESRLLAFGEVLSDQETQAIDGIEPYFEKITPNIIFLALEIGKQGQRVQRRVANLLPKSTGWGTIGGAALIATGGIMLIAAVAFPFLAAGAVVSFAEAAAAIFGSLGGASTLILGSVLVHKSNSEQAGAKKQLLVKAGGDYRARLLDLVLTATGKKEAENDLLCTVVFEELEDFLIRKTSEKTLNELFPEEDIRYLGAFVRVVKVLNQLRKELKSLRIVGLLGNHSNGKSTFLNEAYDFGLKVEGNPISTIKVTAYLHPMNSDVIFLDFPGGDEYGMRGAMQLILGLTMNVMVIITNFTTEINTYINELQTNASSKNTPCLICVNKVDAYHSERAIGRGTRRKPQFKDTVAAVLVIERFLSTRAKALISCFGEKQHIWMTQLNRLELDEDVQEVFQEIQDAEEFRKAFIDSKSPPPENVTDDPGFQALWTFVRNDGLPRSAKHLKEFIARSCYPPEEDESNPDNAVARNSLLSSEHSPFSKSSEVEAFGGAGTTISA
eukprot:gene4067-4448_t